jgi:hypothetical protein
VIFALVNSEADAFGHAATQAPQPMQAAASMAFSATSLPMGRLLASGRGARVHRHIPAGRDDAVERAAVHHQVLDDGKPGRGTARS